MLFIIVAITNYSWDLFSPTCASISTLHYYNNIFVYSYQRLMVPALALLTFQSPSSNCITFTLHTLYFYFKFSLFLRYGQLSFLISSVVMLFINFYSTFLFFIGSCFIIINKNSTTLFFIIVFLCAKSTFT